MTAPELRALAARDRSTAILPTGSLEQHGPHLPVSTDTIGVVAAAQAGARLVHAERPVAVLPPIWTGMSEYHIPFGGTISLDYAAFHAVVRCVVRSLRALGFAPLLIVNGHGGNIAALEVSVRELAVEFAMPIVATTPWLDIAVRDVAETEEVVEHACEAETSLIMALAPELVRHDLLDEAATAHGHRRPRKDLTRFYSFTDCAPVTGTWGDPRSADDRKGAIFAERLGQAVARVIVDEDIWFAPDGVWAPSRGQGSTSLGGSG